jgi:hypothetical protein
VVTTTEAALIEHTRWIGQMDPQPVGRLLPLRQAFHAYGVFEDLGSRRVNGESGAVHGASYQVSAILAEMMTSFGTIHAGSCGGVARLW